MIRAKNLYKLSALIGTSVVVNGAVVSVVETDTLEP